MLLLVSRIRFKVALDTTFLILRARSRSYRACQDSAPVHDWPGFGLSYLWPSL